MFWEARPPSRAQRNKADKCGSGQALALVVLVRSVALAVAALAFPDFTALPALPTRLAGAAATLVRVRRHDAGRHDACRQVASWD